MRLGRVEIRGVRVIDHAVVEAVAGINLLQGANASGKTSFLEALYLCSTGRSFRTHRLLDVVSTSTGQLLVDSTARGEGRGGTRLLIARSHRSAKLEIDGKAVAGTAQLARALPMLVITPMSNSLLEGPPKDRRRLLDWSLFHVERNYLDTWRLYHRALRHRNLLLQGRGDGRSLDAWEAEIGRYGDDIHRRRQAAAAGLSDYFVTEAQACGLGHPSLEYAPGWESDSPLREVLAANREGDAAAGYARFGPHRADLLVMAGSTPAARVWSRGQSKVGISCLVLSQADWIEQASGEAPILLFDDFGAELDQRHREVLGRLVTARAGQTFVTVTEPVQAAFQDAHVAQFHVEQGRIQMIV